MWAHAEIAGAASCRLKGGFSVSALGQGKMAGAVRVQDQRRDADERRPAT
jgi:uncharacterized heparinase superfamily protein